MSAHNRTWPALDVAGLPPSDAPDAHDAVQGDLLEATLTDFDVEAIDETNAAGWRVFFRTRSGRDFGNAVLSRFPIADACRLDLTLPGFEPRGAVDVVIAVPEGPLRVIATHLGLRPRERRDQVKRLLAALVRAVLLPTVLTGDVNEWYLWGRPLRWLHRHFKQTPAPPTFPAWRPVFALDRLWTEPARLLAELRVHSTPLSRMASDHLPLVAKVALPVASPA